jgi:hypothetical protein
MKILKQIFDFYINSSIHVALAVCALSCLTFLEFDVLYDQTLLLFIFFATITGYNFVKYFGLAKFHHRRLAKWLKVIQVFSFICFILLAYFAFKLPFKTLIYIGLFGVLTFLYAIPFLPKHLFIDDKQNLRSISGLKIYIIALVWTGVTVFLPAVNNGISITTDVLILSLQRFIFVIVLTFPFEIRDLQYDSIKLSTVPQKIGIKKTKILGILLLMAFFFLEFFKDDIHWKEIIMLLIITTATLIFLVLSKTRQSNYYSGFWVEGIPIVWLLLVLIT